MINPFRNRKGLIGKDYSENSPIDIPHVRGGTTNPEMAAIRRSQAVIEFMLDGTIIYANDIFLNVMGYTHDQVIGRHHSMFVSPDEAHSAAYANFWKRLGNGEHFAAEFRRFGRNRQEVWIEGSYNPVLDDDGVPFKVVKLATDITVKKLKSADDGGQVTAIGNSQAVITFSVDGRIESANAIFCETMGYAERDIVGKHHKMFVPRRVQSSRAYRDFWRSLANGELQAGEFCRVDRAGRAVWLQASYTPILDPAGRPFKVVKYASDITAAKLRSLQFDSTLTVIGQSIAVAEWTPDGRCSDMNAFLKGRPAAPLSSLFAQADIDSVIRGDQIRREIAWPGADGTPLWLDATLSQIRDLEGRPEKILLCAVDVTPRRRAVAASSAAMRDMLDQMTAIVSNIDRITRTTNMLALNAAVQAGRAGEGGKGFAVVATEIRSLADQSERAVNEINGLIVAGTARIGRIGDQEPVAAQDGGVRAAA